MWISSHVKSYLLGWMGNIAFRLVVDLGKVINFLTKYVTEPEKNMSSGMCYLIRGILHRGLNGNLTMKQNLRKGMGRLIGSRIMSKQKTCYLINNIGFVFSTHTFVSVDILPRVDRLKSIRPNVRSPITGDITSDKSNDVLAGSNIIDLYARRLVPCNWDPK